MTDYDTFVLVNALLLGVPLAICQSIKTIVPILERHILQIPENRPVDYVLQRVNPTGNLLKRLGIRDMKELEVNTSSQEEFFSRLVELIKGSDRVIWMYGYDKEFMKRKETLDAFQQSEANLCAIISESDNSPDFERICYSVDTIHGKTKQGYIVFANMVDGNFSSVVWDSTKLTAYPPERKDGVINRAITYDKAVIHQLMEHYHQVDRSIFERRYASQ